jgi:NTP pyrophosphatase (non-canonical NTP hydrolase)
MTESEHLLTILMEECAEVAQRASKALRFGLTEVQTGQSLTNAERINEELLDLYVISSMLVADGDLESLMDIEVTPEVAARIQAKREKVHRYLRYSEQCGTLTTPYDLDDADSA